MVGGDVRKVREVDILKGICWRLHGQFASHGRGAGKGFCLLGWVELAYWSFGSGNVVCEVGSVSCTSGILEPYCEFDLGRTMRAMSAILRCALSGASLRPKLFFSVAAAFFWVWYGRHHSSSEFRFKQYQYCRIRVGW